MSWDVQNSGTTQYLQAIAFGAGNFVGLAQDGTVLSSPDAKTWTLHPGALPPSFLDLASLSRSQVQIEQSGPVGLSYWLQTSPDFNVWTPDTFIAH